MLKSLQIKNFALIENIEIEFGTGLNIITGETGAGKSIIIGAMGLLLGGRASTDLIRKGAKKTIIEGIYDSAGNDNIKNLMDKYNLDFESELIVRREISLKSASRNFVNDTPVNLNVIKEIGNLLVDLHGQHDHQSLLKSDLQLLMLDEFGNYEDLLNKFVDVREKFSSKISELKRLKENETNLREKKEFYSFQRSEIDKISPVPDEDASLETELKILENSEKLLTNTSEVYINLYESENSIYNKLVQVQSLINELLPIDKVFADRYNQLSESIASINDIADFFRDYNDNLDIDPSKIEEIRNRLAELTLLKKKYGPSLKNVLEYREKIFNELQLAENFSEKITGLETQIEKLRNELSGLAIKLSGKRKKSAMLVKKGVESELKHLGINDARFEIRFGYSEASNDTQSFVLVNNKKVKINNRGVDNIEFFISTNIGEELKPLSKVASGGEISRIMLALKSVLAKTDKLPLLIFDEIDTGVSGRIAQKVGNSIKDLASFHQIIAITHLPQIAAMADHHFVVSKEQINGRVISSLKKIDDNEKIIEVAKLMSGENITDASLIGAKELMGIN
ncbi:DNA repair protein RecN [bacterium BMS3Abin04]|nr:DNA repair protein RecN [bacterium BMS3Abin04]